MPANPRVTLDKYPVNYPTQKTGPAAEYQAKLTLGVAVSTLFLLTPFSVNNFIQGRYLLGVGSLAIMGMLAVSAWGSSHGRYYLGLSFVGLVPVVIFFLILSLREQGVIGALWCFPATVSFYFMLPERLALIANAALITLILPQAWDALEHSIAARVAATLLAVSILSALFVRGITCQQRKLEAQAETDALTGLSNRIPLRPTLEQAFEQSRRTGASMTLVTLDLDEFKSINDAFGHYTGDVVLRGVGELLRKRIRRADKVFRLGGEEFLVLLYNTNEESGLQVAEELRREIAALDLIPGPISASMGVASLRADENCTQWMKRSDENLYRAKMNGRNRVVA